MRSCCSLPLTKLRRGALPFSPDRDLVAQPEQTLRTFDCEPSRRGVQRIAGLTTDTLLDRPTPAAEGGGISAGAGVLDHPEPSLRIDGDAKVMPGPGPGTTALVDSTLGTPAGTRPI